MGINFFRAGINQVTLLGRVGVDPRIRGSAERPAVTFSLATNIRYRPGGPDSLEDFVTKTDWHNIAVFKPGLRSIVADSVHKGGLECEWVLCLRILVCSCLLQGCDST